MIYCQILLTSTNRKGLSRKPNTHIRMVTMPGSITRSNSWFATDILRLTLVILGLVHGVLFAQPSNRITITGAAQAGRPFTISRVFAKGEILNFPRARVAGTPVQTQADVKTRWPDGSVQHAMISFLADVPSGSLVVDFVNQANGNNTGEMTRSAMLSANWGAQMDLTNGSTLTANARQILTDWAGTTADKRVTYWLKGPICTQVILEDRSPTLKYDLGWDTHKSLHPIFVVTFYPGYPAGTRVEMIVENMWNTKLQDQRYAVSLKTGTALTQVYSKPAFTHYAYTRWRKDFWSGTAPSAVNIDYNSAYLTHSRVLPNFDLTKTVPSSAIDNDASDFASSDKGDINGHGMWLKYMPQTGGRDDIGLFPAWTVRYLYTFSSKAYPVMLGNGAVSGHVPLHVREADPNLRFDDQRAVEAFGRTISVDARPSGGPAEVGTVSDSHGWTLDMAHEGSYAFIPYIITGDWYFLEELYQWAAYVTSLGDPTSTEFWGRHGSWGILPHALQTRGVAWGLRELAHAAFAAPDGTPEKTYFRQKLNNNIAVREGEQNIKDGAFYDASAGSKWHWGRNTVGEGLSNPLHFLNRGDDYASKDHLTSAVAWPDSPWQYNYWHIVFGHMDELGFPVTKLKRTYQLNLLHQLQNPAFNPYLAGSYRIPVRQQGTNTFFQTWAAVKSAFSSSRQNVTSWPENDEFDLGHGYPRILKAAASFLPGLTDGSLNGDAAWNWVNSRVGGQDGEGFNPRWSLIPRSTVVGIPPSTNLSRCDANSDRSTDVADVQIAINQVLGTAGCSVDLDNNSKCDVIDLQRVINAALGGTCRVGL
jgi:hypothetical protein